MNLGDTSGTRREQQDNPLAQRAVTVPSRLATPIALDLPEMSVRRQKVDKDKAGGAGQERVQ